MLDSFFFRMLWKDNPWDLSNSMHSGMKIKTVIYQTGMKALKLFWRLRGGRRISAFGHEIRVVPDTTFPSYRKLRLPKGGCHSEIVKYDTMFRCTQYAILSLNYEIDP